jgi:hypothetical protein
MQARPNALGLSCAPIQALHDISSLHPSGRGYFSSNPRDNFNPPLGRARGATAVLRPSDLRDGGCLRIHAVLTTRGPQIHQRNLLHTEPCRSRCDGRTASHRLTRRRPACLSTVRWLHCVPQICLMKRALRIQTDIRGDVTRCRAARHQCESS